MEANQATDPSGPSKLQVKVPRQPGARVGGGFVCMAKQLQKIVKRADLVEFAGMNQSQVEVGHFGAVLSFEEKRVLPIQDSLL